MKITVEKSRLESGDSLVEGNKALSFDIYKKMCKMFFKVKGCDYLFDHILFKLEQNLLARSDNCSAIHGNYV